MLNEPKTEDCDMEIALGTIVVTDPCNLKPATETPTAPAWEDGASLRKRLDSASGELIVSDSYCPRHAQPGRASEDLTEAQGALTTAEAEQLALCEARIEKGMAQVWLTLVQIYDCNLYRAQGKWEDYCKSRWGFEKSRSYQMLDASRVYTTLADQSTNGGLQLPTSERQMRPLAALPSDEMLDVWQAALEKADGKTPSGALVEQAIKERISIKTPAIEATVVTPIAETTQNMEEPITIEVEPLVAHDADAECAPPEETIIPLPISDATLRQIDEPELIHAMASTCKSMARDLGEERAEQVYIVVRAALVTLLPGPPPPDQTPMLLLPLPPRQEAQVAEN